MKVYPFKIPKPLNNNLIIQVDEEDIFYNKLHQHQEIQISYIQKGTGTLLVADSIHTYNPGELYVIGSNLPHVFQCDANNLGKSKMVSIFFTKQSFGEKFFDTVEMNELHSFFKNAGSGFKVTSLPLALENSIKTIVDLSILNSFIVLIQLLQNLSHAKVKTLTSFVYPKNITDADGKRMQIIFDYAISNFTNEITLQSVADLVFMTPNAFCRYFKQRTNKTFFQFLIELRLEYACKLLKTESEMSIEDISIKSGFNNLSNFNRKFKEFKNSTPKRYKNYNY